ncbi:hypothetical protein M407DRAFT_34540 [Tulasnella calospora MUT 4182]|uniref:Uncharacterized protein n=1 Tax=Tulasnella calospora MUT 4182 TaxID=1051891 RepID=A0A0C3Q0I7_9AGAM|nr:hypothetical protein M407DRAFT_34540 [Tulasnella calospora MUT 4182]
MSSGASTNVLTSLSSENAWAKDPNEGPDKGTQASQSLSLVDVGRIVPSSLFHNGLDSRSPNAYIYYPAFDNLLHPAVDVWYASDVRLWIDAIWLEFFDTASVKMRMGEESLST